MDETWLRLSISYPAPDDETVERYFFEQDLYALLYSYGAATINEQDATTLDGKSLPAGIKRLLCYFEKAQAVQAAEVKAQVEQKARNAGINLDASLESFDDQSWKDGWKAFFKPAQVSPHIAVRAPWVELEVPAGVKTIVIEPGMAFGTGLHETTQLCIKAIDKFTTENQIHSMLDVGCGSGVLSIAASKCGVPRVRGIDNDPVCIDVSRENGEYNHVDATFDDTDIWDITEKYDLVVANIISSVLMALKEDLKNAVKPGGHLVLSGILTEEKQDVEDAFLCDMPIQKLSETIMGEWCSLVFIK
jgi:ribosomal protein L11 methyltransferase